MNLATYIPPTLPPVLMSRFGEAIMERRELLGYKYATELAEASAELERGDAEKFKGFSQQTLSRWENDRNGEKLMGASGKMVRTLAYLLKWTSAEFLEHVGVPVATVPLIEDQHQTNLYSFLERYGEKADLSIRIPVYGTIAAGVKGFNVGNEPESYKRYAPEELPKAADPSRLYLVRANGSSMFQEGMTRPVPDGSWLLVEAGAFPEEGQLVAAYIPERDLGVVKQFCREDRNVMLRSYSIGGPVFWSQDYPEMRIEGVIRRIIYEP